MVTAGKVTPGDIETGVAEQEQAPLMGGDNLLQGALGGVLGAVAQERAQGAFTATKGTVASWCSTDRLRPYLDVEAGQVGQRLAASFNPTKWAVILPEAPGEREDLYGPLMIVLTMAAIVLAELKHGEGKVATDATLIGTSLGLCLTYWVLSSLFFYFLGYIFDSSMSIPQSLSATGYALFGFTTLLVVQQFMPVVAYLDQFLWILVVGLSCASLGMAFYHRATVKAQGMIAAGIVMGTQFLFLGYVTYRISIVHTR